MATGPYEWRKVVFSYLFVLYRILILVIQKGASFWKSSWFIQNYIGQGIIAVTLLLVFREKFILEVGAEEIIEHMWLPQWASLRPVG